MKNLLTVLCLFLATGNIFAAQCHVSGTKVAFVPANGLYKESYTHFISQAPNACPVEFTQLNPLVLQYTVTDGLLMWTSVLAPAGVNLENMVLFCNEGINKKTVYMSTETGHISLPKDGVVNQISVEFIRDSAPKTSVIGDSMGYLGEDKNCLFMNESAYQKYSANASSLARTSVKQ